MRRVPLARVLQHVPGVPFGDWDGVAVSGIGLDSRRTAAGELFAALPGSQDHGAAHLQEARARGASALLIPEGLPPPRGMPGIIVSEPRTALSISSAALYDHPSHALNVLGITGSNGKTTVACMLAQILQAAGLPAGYWTTNEVWSGPRRFRPALTTPEAPDLHRFLREVLDGGLRHACMEVSSHSVVQRRIADVAFRAGVVTTVTPDHLDFHGTWQAYVEAKRGFLRQLPSNALCVHNVDDPGACLAAAAATVSRRLGVGFSAAADVQVQAPRFTYGSGIGLVRIQNPAPLQPAHADPLPESFPLSVPMPGRHNLINALQALAVALDLGVPLQPALTALGGFTPPPRRLRVRSVAGRTVIDDVAMNEASFDAVLSTVAAQAPASLVVVVALRGNRGSEVNAGIAATLARWSHRLPFAPLIASLSHDTLARYELDYRVRREEVAAFTEAAHSGGLRVDVLARLEDAITAAVARLSVDGTLLLLGTFGMDDGAALACHLLGAGEEGVRFPEPSFG